MATFYVPIDANSWDSASPTKTDQTTATGNDFVYGATGNEILQGYAGSDHIYGGIGDDHLWGDTKSSGAVSSSDGGDYLYGEAGDDTLYGQAGDDHLDGGDDDDILIGGSGTNTIIGGAGNDIISYRDASVAVVVDLTTGMVTVSNYATDTFSGIEGAEGSEFNDSLTGTGGDDYLHGLGGADDLYGGGGDDWLFGNASGTGAYSAHNDAGDRLFGDAGNDVLFGNEGDDLLVGGSGNNSIVGGTGVDTVSYSQATGPVTIDLIAGQAEAGIGGTYASDTISEVENVDGSQYDDHITGTDDANSLDGGLGDDTLVGNGLDDILNGGPGTDTAVFHGNMADFSISLAQQFVGQKVVVTDNRSQAEIDANPSVAANQGTDTLDSVEYLEFWDGIYSIQDLIPDDFGDYHDDTTPSVGTIGNGSSLTGEIEVSYDKDVFQIALFSGVEYTFDLRAQPSQGTGTLNDPVLTLLASNGTVIDSNDRYYDEQGNYTPDARITYTVVASGTFYLQASGYDDFAGTYTLSVTGDESADRTITGTANSETLDGGSGNDIIDGLAGDDILSGGGGNDLLDGGAGVNQISGGDGVDEVFYSASTEAVNVNLSNGTADAGEYAADTISGIENVTGSHYGDIITGDDGDNVIDAGDGDDVIYAKQGNDTIIGGTGADEIRGQGGIDTVSYADSVQGVGIKLDGSAGWGGADGDILFGIENVVGSTFDDTITGDASANVIDAGEGNDLIYAKEGNDTVNGGAGDDEIYGHNGDDKIFGNSGNDLIIGGAGADEIRGQSGIDTVSYARASQGVGIKLDGSAGWGGASGDTIFGTENLIGSDFDDTLSGDDGDNVIDAGDGDDVIYAKNGNDTIIGGAGADEIRGQGGIDTVSYADSVQGVGIKLDGSAGWGGADGDILFGIENVVGSTFDDTITGDASANVIDAGEGNDLIYAKEGNDTVNGGAGDDEIYGHNGDDKIFGNSGNDLIIGGAGADEIRGQSGIDTVSYARASQGVGIKLDGSAGWGGASGDTIFGTENLIGSDFDDTLSGDDGDNVIDAGDGDDVIYAKQGNDTIIGGAGDDEIYGQGGLDTFVFADGYGNDVIHGFAAYEAGEKIDLSGLSTIADIDDLFNNGHMQKVGSDVVIDDFTGNTITLVGVALSALDVDDFQF